MKEDRPRIILVSRGIVLNDEGKLLLIQRSKNDKRNPSLWECPGGKLDEGQDLRNAFEREIMEETGLLAGPTQHTAYVDSYVVDKGEYKGMPYISIFSIGKSIGGKLKLSKEHQDFSWASYNEALEYELTTETRKALIILKDELSRM